MSVDRIVWECNEGGKGTISDKVREERIFPRDTE
jgi:hypothetical protein